MKGYERKLVAVTWVVIFGSLVGCVSQLWWIAKSFTSNPKQKHNDLRIGGNEIRHADGCYHVLIDAGANIGVHGRFLLEPQKYPDAHKAHEIFNREFGEERDNRDFCVFAFEPNPHHYETLRNNSEAYKAMGWRYHVMPFGVSDENGTMVFYHQGDSQYMEWGFRSGAGSVTNDTEVVPSIRLATWLEQNVNQRKVPPSPYQQNATNPKVVLKMDIEGSEWKVLPDLISTGSLCDGVDYVFGEFHRRFEVPNTTTPWDLKGAIKRLIQYSRNCKTVFEELDDESYLTDGMPLPTPDDNNETNRE